MDTTHLLLGLLIGLLIGIALAAIITRRGRKRLAEMAAAVTRVTVEREVLASQVKAEQQRLNELKEANAEQIKALKQQHDKELTEQLAMMREQFRSLSEEVLIKRAEQLGDDNKVQLSSILTPLQADIKQMREAVEKSDREHSTTMERLDASIKATLASSHELGERADRLSKALTSDNKLQGNFGELKLKQLLDDIGLQEGLQYELQTALRDADGNLIKPEGRTLIPDVILHFPDQRDVIIDSKMSWTAYEEYCNAADEQHRSDALHRHIDSVRAQIDLLSRKNYSRYTRGKRLDFVLMYMHSGNALQLALLNDPRLYQYGYDKGVILADNHSLYMTLRLLELAWRQQHQFENQQEIMAAADQLVERVQILAERFQVARRSLDKTTETFIGVERSLSASGQSVTVAARKLLRYGAKESGKHHKLPPSSSDDMIALPDDDDTKE